jgi:hypothetical protein
MNRRALPVVVEALAAADQSFADTGNVLEALRWISFAVEHGEPVPPRIATWLQQGIGAFLAETSTLESALGLTGSGKADPRRAARERNRWPRLLGEMALLHTLGATIEQAAALVALRVNESASALAEHYRRSGRGHQAQKDRPGVLKQWHHSEVEQILSVYPEPMSVGRDAAFSQVKFEPPREMGTALAGKLRIRKMCAKGRT